MTATQLDNFTSAYLECALWSSTDNADNTGGQPLDRNYGVGDIAPETLARMVEDCARFQSENAADLRACGQDDEYSGHDFWLTRCGHGAGFWDRDPSNESERKALERLSLASKEFGNVDLYVGDDGKIYA